MQHPLDLYQPDVTPSNLVRPIAPEPEPEPGAMGSFFRRATHAVLPTAAGVAAAPAGAVAGAATGALIAPWFGPAAPFVEGGFAIGGGLVAAFGAGAGASAAEDSLIPDDAQRALGWDPATQAADAQAHPFASFLGEVGPQILFMRPGWNGARAAAGAAAIGGGVEAGQEFAQTGEIDVRRVAVQAGAGALLGRNTRLGDIVQAPAHVITRIPIGVGRTEARAGASDVIAAGAAELGVPEAEVTAREAHLAEIYPNLSPATRLDIARAELVAEAAKGHMTPAEQAAQSVIASDAHIEASNAFGGDGAAAAHGAEQAKTAARLLAPTPSGARPVPRETIARSTLLSGAADPAKLRDPPVEQFLARIRNAESKSDHDVNPEGGASGRYQFTRNTWLSYYRRRFGSKLSADAIWGKRFDNSLQEVLVRDLAADNKKMLQEAGLPVTAGNMYLLHFSGPKGIEVLRAAPDTPTSRIYSSLAIARNRRVLEGKTAADVIAWAERKMGETPSRRPPIGEEVPKFELAEEEARAVPPEDFEARPSRPAEDERPMLRADLFGSPEEHARAQLAMWREQDAQDGFAELVDDPPPAPPPGPVIEATAPRQRARSDRADVLQAVAQEGGINDREGHDLVVGRGIPKFTREAGTIIREGGRTIDEIGEALWDRGFFGPPAVTDRPTEADVLELIERGVREKVYLPHLQGEMAERGRQAMEQPEDEARWEIAETARDLGFELSEPMIDEALSRRARGAAVDDAVHETVAAAAYRDLGPEAGLERFDDPDGAGIEAQIQSMEHDLRMMSEAADDGATYQLTEDGPEMTLGEIFEEIEADERAIAEMGSCMLPPVQEAAE
jgi:hypothetical protein